MGPILYEQVRRGIPYYLRKITSRVYNTFVENKDYNKYRKANSPNFPRPFKPSKPNKITEILTRIGSLISFAPKSNRNPKRFVKVKNKRLKWNAVAKVISFSNLFKRRDVPEHSPKKKKKPKKIQPGRISPELITRPATVHHPSPLPSPNPRPISSSKHKTISLDNFRPPSVAYPQPPKSPQPNPVFIYYPEPTPKEYQDSYPNTRPPTHILSPVDEELEEPYERNHLPSPVPRSISTSKSKTISLHNSRPPSVAYPQPNPAYPEPIPTPKVYQNSYPKTRPSTHTLSPVDEGLDESYIRNPSPYKEWVPKPESPEPTKDEYEDRHSYISNDNNASDYKSEPEVEEPGLPSPEPQQSIEEESKPATSDSLNPNNLDEDYIARVTKQGYIIKLDENWVSILIWGRIIVLRIPESFKPDWEPTKHLYKPKIELKLQWIYGYQGNVSNLRNVNLHYLSSGEIVYYIGSIVILYHFVKKTQRHYFGHSGHVSGIAIHPSSSLIATCQEIIQTDITQESHVQIWNYETLELVCTVSADKDKAGISSIAFSDAGQQMAYLLIVDKSKTSTLTVYKNIEFGSAEIVSSRLYTDQVYFAAFTKQTTFVTVSKETLNLWSFNKEEEPEENSSFLKMCCPCCITTKAAKPENDEVVLQKKMSVTTYETVTCFAITGIGEIITADQTGKIVVWKDTKVIKELTEIEQETITAICVMTDGSFVTCAEDDNNLVIYNQQYNFIRKGCVIEKRFGFISCCVKKSYSVTLEGKRLYNLLIGTKGNYILDVSFTLENEETTFSYLKINIIVETHATKVRMVKTLYSQSDEHFVSCSNERMMWWNSTSNQKTFTKEFKESKITCLDIIRNGSRVVFGTNTGTIIVAQNSDFIQEHSISHSGIQTLSISSQGDRVAIGTKDASLYIVDLNRSGGLDEQIQLTGCSKVVTKIDWSSSIGSFLRLSTNDSDYFCTMTKEGDTLKKESQFRSPMPAWATSNCPIAFEMLGVWTNYDDKTYIRSYSISQRQNVVAVTNSHGRVNLYQYPCAQDKPESVEMMDFGLKYSAVTFLENSELITTCKDESIMMKWKIV